MDFRGENVDSDPVLFLESMIFQPTCSARRRDYEKRTLWSTGSNPKGVLVYMS